MTSIDIEKVLPKGQPRYPDTVDWRGAYSDTPVARVRTDGDGAPVYYLGDRARHTNAAERYRHGHTGTVHYVASSGVHLAYDQPYPGPGFEVRDYTRPEHITPLRPAVGDAARFLGDAFHGSARYARVVDADVGLLAVQVSYDEELVTVERSVLIAVDEDTVRLWDAEHLLV